MKIVDNVEMSNVKEVVISHKVFYVRDEEFVYVRDDSKTVEASIKNDRMPKELTSEDMADYIRTFVGRRKWKIVFSTGTINIFKKGTKQKTNNIVIKTKKSKKSKE